MLNNDKVFCIRLAMAPSLSFQFTCLVKVCRRALYHNSCADEQSACEVNYHHNFKVYKGERTYYGGVPDIVQASEHQFIEHQVIEMWLSLMDNWYVITNDTTDHSSPHRIACWQQCVLTFTILP